MLVISRGIDQTLWIGPDIKVTITAISGKSTRLGIEAPAHVQIVRDELIEEIEYPQPEPLDSRR